MCMHHAITISKPCTNEFLRRKHKLGSGYVSTKLHTHVPTHVVILKAYNIPPRSSRYCADSIQTSLTVPHSWGSDCTTLFLVKYISHRDITHCLLNHHQYHHPIKHCTNTASLSVCALRSSISL